MRSFFLLLPRGNEDYHLPIDIFWKWVCVCLRILRCWFKMPTPLRRDEELSEDQDLTIDDDDEESLAGKSCWYLYFFKNYFCFLKCLWCSANFQSYEFVFLDITVNRRLINFLITISMIGICQNKVIL